MVLKLAAPGLLAIALLHAQQPTDAQFSKLSSQTDDTDILRPDSLEQARIIGETRSYVMNYTKQLPNFICVEEMRRDIDPTGKGRHWHHIDTDMIRVSYFEHHEDYQVVLVNNHPVNNLKLEQLGGTFSQGEFGSLMKQIFEPDSRARFTWDRLDTLRGKGTLVFAYDIQQMYSKYHVMVDKSLSTFLAYRGLVYIDRTTKMVTKITMSPYDFPAGFLVRDIHESLDYDFTKIGSAKYLLPLKAMVTCTRSDNYIIKNEIKFRLYRKFGTETTIKFDTPEAPPENKERER